MMKRTLAAFILLFIGMNAAFSHEDHDIEEYKNPYLMEDCKDIGFPTEFNDMIKAAWLKHNLRWAPWHCYFLGQIYLESGANPEALSHKAAGGIAQLVKEAEYDCQVQAGMLGNRWEVLFSINCAAWLDKRNGNFWKSEREEFCRLVLAWVGYVSGSGHPIKSQKIARKNGRTAVCWEDGIREFMPQVVSEDSAEAANFYVVRITELGEMMQ